MDTMENTLTVNPTSSHSDTRILRDDDAIERVMLDKGTRGKIISVRRRSTRETFVVKTVVVGKDDPGLPQLCLSRQRLREIRLLRLFRGHKNIVSLEDLGVDFKPDGTFDEANLYFSPMDTNLSAIIVSKQPLTDSHYQSFLYQILCGLKYIHSAGIVHADLSPSNILIDLSGGLRIGDFGSAQIAVPKDQSMRLWWSDLPFVAPEIFVAPPSVVLSPAADIWSAGCMLGILIAGDLIVPKFEPYEMYISFMLSTWDLGSTEEATERIMGTKEFVLSKPLAQGLRFDELLPNATPLCLDFISQLLRFDAQLRPTADEALQHPYCSVWYDTDDHPTCPKVFDEDLDTCSREDVQKLIALEVETFQQERKTFFHPDDPLGPVDGHSATQAHSSGHMLNQTSSWMSLSEDSNLHYESTFRSPIGNDNMGSLNILYTGSE